MVLPDSGPAHVSPEVERQLVPLLQLEGLQQGNEDWEDGGDAASLRCRDCRDLDLLVELILQVQSKPVEIGVSSHVIANLRVAAVGGVGEIGMIKLEQFLRRSHGEAVLGTEELKSRNILSSNTTNHRLNIVGTLEGDTVRLEMFSFFQLLV